MLFPFSGLQNLKSLPFSADLGMKFQFFTIKKPLFSPSLQPTNLHRQIHIHTHARDALSCTDLNHEQSSSTMEGQASALEQCNKENIPSFILPCKDAKRVLVRRPLKDITHLYSAAQPAFFLQPSAKAPHWQSEAEAQ